MKIYGAGFQKHAARLKKKFMVKRCMYDTQKKVKFVKECFITGFFIIIIIAIIITGREKV